MARLDEDNGPINEKDEIYAVAIFREGDEGERIQYSQKIVRYFDGARYVHAPIRAARKHDMGSGSVERVVDNIARPAAPPGTQSARVD